MQMTAAEYQTYIRRQKKNRCLERTHLGEMIYQAFDDVEAEYKFHPTRKWRFDWVVPAIRVAIEFNGLSIGNASKSRHQTVTGLTGDCEKLNQAQLLGWRVLQYTALNYRQFEVDVKKLNNKNNNND